MAKGNKKKKKVNPTTNKVNEVENFIEGPMYNFTSSDSDNGIDMPSLKPYVRDPDEVLKNISVDSAVDLPVFAIDSDDSDVGDNTKEVDKFEDGVKKGNFSVKKGFLLGKDKDKPTSTKTNTKPITKIAEMSDSDSDVPPALLIDSSDDSDSNKNKKKSEKKIEKKSETSSKKDIPKLAHSDSDSDIPPFLAPDSSDSDESLKKKKIAPNASLKPGEPSVKKDFSNKKETSKAKKDDSSDDDSDTPPGLLQDSEDSESDIEKKKKKKKKKKKRKSDINEPKDPDIKKGFARNKKTQEIERVLEMNSDGVYDSEDEISSSSNSDSDDEKGLPPGLVSDSDDSVNDTKETKKSKKVNEKKDIKVVDIKKKKSEAEKKNSEDVLAIKREQERLAIEKKNRENGEEEKKRQLKLQEEEKKRQLKIKKEKDEEKKIELERIALEKLKLKKVIVIQKTFRMFISRKKYGSGVKQLLRRLKLFTRYWKDLKFSIIKSSKSDQFSWDLERQKYDMVVDYSDFGEISDVLSKNAVTSGTSSELQAKFAKAVSDSVNSEVQLNNRNTIINNLSLNDYQDAVEIESKVESQLNKKMNDLSLDAYEYDNEYEEGIEYENEAVADNIEISNPTMKWLEKQDSKYSSMFWAKIDELSTGRRSYALSKRLKGTTHPIYETKLDSGMRILWTQLRRQSEAPSLIIWFVSKHDDVSKYLRVMNDYFSRQKKMIVEIVLGGDNKTGRTKCETQGNKLELSEDMTLLDPIGNSPLKIFTARRDQLGLICTSNFNGKLPLRLSSMEKEVNKRIGTVLLLGRSGTGKTVCLSNRMASDRKEKMKHNGKIISQLFVCRSRRLCEAVKRFQSEYYNSPEVGADVAGDERFKNVNNAVFRTLDEFIDRVDSVVSREKNPSTNTYQDFKYINFELFKKAFMGDYVLKHSILTRKKDLIVDPLIVWTQIRSFIKGSAECIRDRKYLEFETYMNFSKDRCRLDPVNRQRVYTLFLWYQEFLQKGNFWDDCDRVFDLLCRSEMDANLSFAETDEKEAYDQVYVDEIQDSTQAEIVLFFLVSGLKYTNLFLAGDPAQSVVEGVDFRFEEVRGIVHMLTNGVSKIDKAYKLITNYRSHAGILNCATAILNLMFDLFPAAATHLTVDRGFCKGPRPIYFHDKLDIDGNSSIMKRMLLKNQKIVVLCRDELFENDNDNEISQRSYLKQFVPEGILSLGIRAAKGMEFSDVLLVDFFSSLPIKDQDYWKRRLTVFQDGTNFVNVEETEYPEMESVLKLLYTAITRCCNRLIFVETKETAASKSFFRWLKEKDLAQIHVPNAEEDANTDQSIGYISPDEWVLRGITLAQACEDAYEVNKQSHIHYEEALKCFTKAGANISMARFKKSIEIQAQVYDMIRVILQLSKKWLQVEVQDLVGVQEQKQNEIKLLQNDVRDLCMKCVQNNLLREGYNLLKRYKDCYLFHDDKRHRMWIEEQLISNFGL